MEKLSIIVPVYNEAAQLRQVIETLMASYSPIPREWIFVDDCSTDPSLSILRSHASRYGYRILTQEKNLGKGMAVIRGVRESTGDIVMVQDADFEYDPNEIPSLLEPILKGEADVVYGSRFKKKTPASRRTCHYFANRLLTALSNGMSGLHLTDMETCYKVFRADLLKAMNLKSKRFGIEIEMTAYVTKVRARLEERPISYRPRTRLQGKKINWKDGFAAFFHLARFYWFTPLTEAFHEVPPPYSHFPKKF
ncbi:MAG: glycosyltransferase family 2 protein [bacterium]